MTGRCARCGRFTGPDYTIVIDRHMTGNGLEVDDYIICRRCSHSAWCTKRRHEHGPVCAVDCPNCLTFEREAVRRG